MDELTSSVLKTLICKVNAMELIILESDKANEYQNNLKEWTKKIDSEIGGAYLKSLENDDFDD